MRSAKLALLVVLVAAGHAVAARPARLHGVVEGYYGRPWTGEARRDVIRFLGAHRLDTFVYGPKNDDHHRDRWREPYPADALADLRATALAGRKARVTFVYALSPGLDACYSCGEDFRAVVRKLRQLARVRVRHFALFFDDAPLVLQRPEDIARYGGSDQVALARAQADLINRTARWLRSRGLSLDLIVPTDYAGTTCSPYHVAMAERLGRRIPVGWTGPGVFAAEISTAAAEARARCMPGHPVVLWDNFPVNDTVLSINLHLGPLTGRAPDLPAALGGYLLNPMTQAHASLVALGTAASYLTDPAAYDPEAAWQTTLAELTPSSGFRVLAEQTRSSALDLDDARALRAAIDGVVATFGTPDWLAAVEELAGEEARQGQAPRDIAEKLGGTPLGDEIAPWVDELASHAARGSEAVQLLLAMKPVLGGVMATVDGVSLRVRGRAVPPAVGAAQTLGPGFVAEASTIAQRIAAPPVGPFSMCLGDFLSADIRFCPDFGLNVHGKALYVVFALPAGVQVVSDRNVHDRLVQQAAALYAEWAPRQGPGSTALTVTLDGAPVPLAAEGAFDVTVPQPVSGRARLVVTTGVGDATGEDVP